jgi:hypothetical protein
MAQQKKEREVDAAAGETADGSTRQNDRATKILIKDITDEESVKAAESLSCDMSEE